MRHEVRRADSEAGPDRAQQLPTAGDARLRAQQVTFCSFYKDKPFRVRPFEEIREDLTMAREFYPYDPPVFLIDGDATCLKPDRLIAILEEVRRTFPNSPRTNMYGRFADVYRNYSVDDLRELKRLNVKRMHMGMESGSDKVLADVRKGVTRDQIVEASRRMREAGLSFNGGVIFGLGGVADSEEHIRESVEVINEMRPGSLGNMALSLQPGTPLYDDWRAGRFELPTYRDVLREERQFLEGIDPDLELEAWTGGLIPGEGFITGNFPEDRERVMRAVRGRRVPERLLDQRLMVGGMI